MGVGNQWVDAAERWMSPNGWGLFPCSFSLLSEHINLCQNLVTPSSRINTLLQQLVFGGDRDVTETHRLSRDARYRLEEISLLQFLNRGPTMLNYAMTIRQLLLAVLLVGVGMLFLGTKLVNEQQGISKVKNPLVLASLSGRGGGTG
jgi:hypothetical protein